MLTTLIERFKDGFRMLMGDFVVPSGPLKKVGYTDESSMHNSLFHQIDEFRDTMSVLASRCNKVVMYNRMYLHGDEPVFNTSVDGVMFVFTPDNAFEYEVRKLNKVTGITQRHVVGYQQIEDGSFLGLFK